jgi:hypothetical protein
MKAAKAEESRESLGCFLKITRPLKATAMCLGSMSQTPSFLWIRERRRIRGRRRGQGSNTGKSEVQAAILTVKFIPRSLCRWSSRLSTPHLSPVPHSGSDPLFHPHFAPFSRTLNLPKFITKFIPKSLMLTFVQTVAFTHRASLSADSQVLPVSAAAHQLPACPHLLSPPRPD